LYASMKEDEKYTNNLIETLNKSFNK
jgi:hypothetical protein